MNKLKVSIDGAVVVINGAHEKNFIEADIVINPSIGQDEKYYQHLKQTKYYLGPDYMILSPKFSEKSINKKIKIKPEKVLVCMGGSDHQNLTYFVLKAIDKSRLDFSCDVILSSAFFDRKHIENQAKKLKHKINIFYDLKSLVDPLKQADLAITAGGNTLFDRLCLGVPGIVVNQLLHQTETSQKVMDYGATLNLGYYKYVSEQNLLDQFDSLMLNKNYRKKMSERGKSIVDGKGVCRVSEIIVGACK
jgi:spore coat polysaccharide biosynthesis predicted glycosyltransferase SpsG